MVLKSFLKLFSKPLPVLNMRVSLAMLISKHMELKNAELLVGYKTETQAEFYS